MGRGNQVRGYFSTYNSLMSPLHVAGNTSSQVEISDEALTGMLSLCEQAGPLETGGILVGSYSVDGTVAHVSEALGPPRGSRSTPTGFTRNSGMNKALQRRWSKQKYYLGEWHSHPKGRTTPSHQDRRQIAAIGNDASYCCPSPILIVAGRSKGDWKLGVWVFINSKLLRLREVTNGVQ